MKTIWKFHLPFPGGHVEMPRGAQILCIQIQNGEPMLWAEVEPETAKETRSFLVFGTGHTLIRQGNYIGTFQQPSSVWHVYEEEKP